MVDSNRIVLYEWSRGVAGAALEHHQEVSVDFSSRRAYTPPMWRPEIVDHRHRAKFPENPANIALSGAKRPVIQWLGIMKIPLAVGIVVLLAACTPDEPVKVPRALMSELPLEVQDKLTSLCREPCVFADTGERWNATDVLLDGSPRRRLISVNHAGSKWVIEYEHGGIGRHNHRVVFELTPSIHIASGSSCMPTASQECEW